MRWMGIRTMGNSLNAGLSISSVALGRPKLDSDTRKSRSCRYQCHHQEGSLRVGWKILGVHPTQHTQLKREPTEHGLNWYTLTLKLLKKALLFSKLWGCCPILVGSSSRTVLSPRSLALLAAPASLIFGFVASPREFSHSLRCLDPSTRQSPNICLQREKDPGSRVFRLLTTKVDVNPGVVEIQKGALQATPFCDNPKVNLNPGAVDYPGAVDFPKRQAPGMKSTLG